MDEKKREKNKKEMEKFWEREWEEGKMKMMEGRTLF